jgi:DNA-binding HxlR family transcriptional regulator
VPKEVELTQCLRRLEASGLITRSVVITSPVAVAYQVSPLVASLEPHMKGIFQWSLDHRDQVAAAREAFAAQDADRQVNGP